MKLFMLTSATSVLLSAVPGVFSLEVSIRRSMQNSAYSSTQRSSDVFLFSHNPSINIRITSCADLPLRSLSLSWASKKSSTMHLQEAPAPATTPPTMERNIVRKTMMILMVSALRLVSSAARVRKRSLRGLVFASTMVSRPLKKHPKVSLDTPHGPSMVTSRSIVSVAVVRSVEGFKEDTSPLIKTTPTSRMKTWRIPMMWGCHWWLLRPTPRSHTPFVKGELREIRLVWRLGIVH